MTDELCLHTLYAAMSASHREKTMHFCKEHLTCNTLAGVDAVLKCAPAVCISTC